MRRLRVEMEHSDPSETLAARASGRSIFRRSRSLAGYLQYGIPALILLFGLALRAWDPAPVDDMRLRIFDYYQYIKPRAYEPLPVHVVALDDESLLRYGQWPWPRVLLVRLLKQLTDAGAAAIAFDIVFSEPDRTSPLEIIKHWPEGLVDENLRERVAQLKSHDELFAAAIRKAGNVALGFVLTPYGPGIQPRPRTGYGFTGDDPRQFVPRFEGSVLNLRPLAAAAAGGGSLNIVPERDGVVRRVPLLVNFVDKIYPALSLDTLRVVQGASTLLVKSSGASGEKAFGQESGVISVKIGRLEVPTDAAGRIWLYQTREQDVRFVPAWKILAGDFDRSKIEGSILFIGLSGAGVADFKTTPTHVSVPGVAVHAQIAEQMILGSYLTRPDWATGAELFFLLIVGTILVLLVPRLGAGWSALTAGVCVAFGVGLSWYTFSADSVRLLIDPVYPVFIVGIVFFSGSILSYLRSEQDRRQLRGMFGMYVSRKLVDRLVAHPEEVVIGGEMRPLTVMFIDVRGFTTRSENMTAGDLTKFMNRFLTAMTAAVLDHDGTISHYTGDGLMAFWNAPVDQPDHAQRACRAALDMGVRLAGLNAHLESEALTQTAAHKPIRIGIGINTGECCVGNIGSEQRFDYSALGDSVNVAARLEAETKTYGVPIIIGESTREAVPEFACEEIGRIKVRGRDTPLMIFSLIGVQHTE